MLLHWVFVAVCRLSLVVASGGYSLVAVHGLLIAVASLVSEHRLLSTGSVAVARCTGLVAPWHEGSSWTSD